MKPVIKDDPMYKLLREGKIEEFNSKKLQGETFDFTGCDFRAVDLRGMDAAGIDFSNCYFRRCDLRGVDLREANLEGASLANANISGSYLPYGLSAQEILMSITHGTRLRYQKYKE